MAWTTSPASHRAQVWTGKEEIHLVSWVAPEWPEMVEQGCGGLLYEIEPCLKSTFEAGVFMDVGTKLRISCTVYPKWEKMLVMRLAPFDAIVTEVTVFPGCYRAEYRWKSTSKLGNPYYELE